MKVTFIGGGNMATALIGGMLKQGFAANEIAAVEIDPDARARLSDAFNIATYAGVPGAVPNSDVIVLAVKPQQLREVALQAQPRVGGALILSIVAGIRMRDMALWLRAVEPPSPSVPLPPSPRSRAWEEGEAVDPPAPSVPLPPSPRSRAWEEGEAVEPPTPSTHSALRIVRCMPNTPALIGMGITAACGSSDVSAADRALVDRILGAVGKVVWVEREALLDPVTAVSGSGPAYVFYFLEAMIQAAQALGLAPEVGRQLALETFRGATELAMRSTEPLATLRARVTSKGGTTAAAIASMDHDQLKAVIVRALGAANRRAGELADEFGTQA